MASFLVSAINDTNHITNPKQQDQAVIAIAGHWYNNHEAVAPIRIQTVPLSAQFILDGMRCKGVLE